MKRASKIICGALIPLSLIILILSFFETSNTKKLNAIEKAPAFMKGRVIDKTYYKGKSIRYEYSVQGKKYNNSFGRISPARFDEIQIGDSIDIKYDSRNPKNSIIE